MRLFISIGFDEKTKDNLMGVMENLKKCSRKGMFYDRENLRLNFLLLHEIDDVSIIKKAVEKIFGVNVEKVNTLNYDGKVKRMGRSEGRTASFKKAVVKLTADSKEIEFFQGM